jgi:hypothetical protein
LPGAIGIITTARISALGMKLLCFVYNNPRLAIQEVSVIMQYGNQIQIRFPLDQLPYLDAMVTHQNHQLPTGQNFGYPAEHAQWIFHDAPGYLLVGKRTQRVDESRSWLTAVAVFDKIKRRSFSEEMQNKSRISSAAGAFL